MLVLAPEVEFFEVTGGGGMEPVQRTGNPIE